MFRRTWIPATYDFPTAESKIVIYDSGVHYGEMICDEWTCWEIQSRGMNDRGYVEEILKKMPEGWAPFDTFTQEIYLGSALPPHSFQIRGWSVLTEEVLVAEPSQLSHRSVDYPQRQALVPQPQALVPQALVPQGYIQVSRIPAVKRPLSNHTGYTSRSKVKTPLQLQGHSSRFSVREPEQAQAIVLKSNPSSHSQGPAQPKRPFQKGPSQTFQEEKRSSLLKTEISLKANPSQPSRPKQPHQKDPQVAPTSTHSPQTVSLKIGKTLQSTPLKEKNHKKQFWIPLIQAVQTSP